MGLLDEGRREGVWAYLHGLNGFRAVTKDGRTALWHDILPLEVVAADVLGWEGLSFLVLEIVLQEGGQDVIQLERGSREGEFFASARIHLAPATFTALHSMAGENPATIRMDCTLQLDKVVPIRRHVIVIDDDDAEDHPALADWQEYRDLSRNVGRWCTHAAASPE